MGVCVSTDTAASGATTPTQVRVEPTSVGGTAPHTHGADTIPAATQGGTLGDGGATDVRRGSTTSGKAMDNTVVLPAAVFYKKYRLGEVLGKYDPPPALRCRSAAGFVDVTFLSVRRGGFATVYKGVNVETNTEYAIKLIDIRSNSRKEDVRVPFGLVRRATSVGLMFGERRGHRSHRICGC